MTVLYRILLVVGMLGLWFLSQKLLSNRGFKGEGIQDKVHDWSASLNDGLNKNPVWANRLLVSSSLGIDLLGLYLLLSGIFGESVTPLVGLFILFSLRQISQYLTALPAPRGMIWRSPGVPSLFVTYGVSNDLFFSGHTALAVYGALQVYALDSVTLSIAATILAIYEVIAVLLLRAHWTMDVYAGAVTALLVQLIATSVGPWIDALVKV